jgi:hypothetical protein
MSTGLHQETLRFASLVRSRHAGTWELPKRMRLFALGIMAVLATAIAGCGSTITTSAANSSAVTVVVTSPTNGTVIAGSNITVRGTVVPTNAVVQIQGQPAAVGNGVFTGTAKLQSGKTTIDVIGSAPGKTPGSTSVTVTQQGNSQHSSSGGSASRTTTVVRTVVAPPAQQASPPSSSTSKAFYAPSGNVNCSIQSESAQCSVASAGLTFILPQGGGSAYTTSGLSVSRGSGSEAPFDTEQTDGVIVCSIPPSSTPAGITCRDTASGHGFEASRLAARQSVY